MALTSRLSPRRSTRLAAAGLILLAAFGAWAASTPPVGSSLAGDIRMHDPSTIVRSHGKYWVFSTGKGIGVHSSADGVTWQREPAIFAAIPDALRRAVPLNNGLDVWAPDVARLNGQYSLYYSVSHWGSEVSAIGLLTSPTLDPTEAGYHWTDHGVVVQSKAGEKMNTIDPCIFSAPDGTLWLTYGSYIGTVNVIQLDPKTGLRLAPGSPSHPLSSHSEASALIHHGDYYYLFVNRGSCCKGAQSTYHLMMGRASTPIGPYRDKAGRDLLEGGGTMFLASAPGKIGPGHFGLLSENGIDRFSLHYEADPTRGNRSVLDIRPLLWDADGWPQAGENQPAPPSSL